MTTRAQELLVGVFVIAGLAALFMLAVSVSSQSIYHLGDRYTIKARFDNVGGLKKHALVSASGVPVGHVADIQYNSEGFEALVTMSIDTQYDKFPVDTAASVLTSSLLGDQYIGLEPGAEEEYLTSGAEIDITQSALVLEHIIGQFLYGKADE